MDLVQKIESEYLRKSELETLVKDREAKLILQRKLGADQDVTKFDSLPKQIKNLKTIVTKKNLRVNECVAEIKNQRDKISELRKERTLLDGIYSKLETQIKTKSA
jgi:hypothetical protein